MAWSEKFSEYRRSMNAKGYIVPSSDRKTYEIPRPYRRFIGTVSDNALFRNFYERKSEQVHGQWVFWVEKRRPMFTASEIGEIVDACDGNKGLISYVMAQASTYGIKGIREMSTDDFEGRVGVGKRRLDALVAIGVRDVRDKVERTPFNLDGLFDGTIDGVEVHGRIEGQYTSTRGV